MLAYGLTVDVTRCTGCYSCFLACKDEFVGNDYAPLSAAQPSEAPSWLRIDETTHGSGSKVKVDYTVVMCQHCQDAPCIKPEFGDAVYRRADGIVIIDPVKAKGRKEIVASCPYGVIFWNEELGLAQKCTLCAQMIDAGEKTTRCVETCPTQALAFGDLDDAHSAVSRVIQEKEGRHESLQPELGTRPSILYYGLPKPFIAGEVLLAGKEGECAKGVKVTLLSKAGQSLAVAETDFLGDFEFKGLAAGGEYTLRAEFEGYAARELAVRTDASVNVGELVLAAR
jgi:Fe-S-cluster-containing dehydrogenase component